MRFSGTPWNLSRPLAPLTCTEHTLYRTAWNIVERAVGGWGGIRTHETVARLPVFKTGAFNRSATHPSRNFSHIAMVGQGVQPELPPNCHPQRSRYVSLAMYLSGPWGEIVMVWMMKLPALANSSALARASRSVLPVKSWVSAMA